MLVLSRKPGEKLVIGGNIEVTVVAVCGNRVKLGFSAPQSVSIQREEVWLRGIQGCPPPAPEADRLAGDSAYLATG